MSQTQIYVIGAPLLLVVLPAVVTSIRLRREERVGRLQMFFVWLAAYSMLVVAVGLLATLAVFFCFGGIPGTATAGGNIDGNYYFNWHDQTYTEVSKETWERAFFLEQLAMHTIGVPVCVFLGSALMLLVTLRRTSPVSEAPAQVECREPERTGGAA